MPGAYAIVTVDQGRVRFTHFGSDDDLIGVPSHVTHVGEFNALYAQNHPTSDIRNSDVSPNFPDAARIWAGMWQTKSGQHVDGAVALDPSALGYLLKATGPATLPGRHRHHAPANVVEFTQERQYQLYGGTSDADIAARKRFLAGLAKAVAGPARHRPRRARARRRPAARGARAPAGRCGATCPAEERAIETRRRRRRARPGHPAVRRRSSSTTPPAASSTSTCDTAMVYRRSSCAAGATATATLTLHNDTPSYPLPPYVTTVLGAKPAGRQTRASTG